MTGRSWWVLALLLMGGVAAAQDAESDPASSADPPVDEAGEGTAPVGSLDLMAPPYSEGWRWVRRSPVRGQAVVDVAAHPARPDRLAAVDDEGQIWTSTDGGRIWNVSFGAVEDGWGQLSTEEDVLLDVDARLGEILDDSQGIDLDPEIDDAEVEEAVTTAVDDAVSEGGSEILTDLEADPSFVLGDEEAEEVLVPRITYAGTDLFASVGNVLYLSPDDGRTWGVVLDLHVYDVIRLGSLSVALTEDGSRVALEPRSWFDVVDGTEGRDLSDGAVADEVLVAASQDGLWATRDGQTWNRWGDLRGVVRSIAVNPEDPTTLWAVTEQGLRRSDDRGLTFGGVLVRGQVDDVAAPMADRVVVSRPGIVLESMDRGLSWTPITQGLSGVADGRLQVRSGGGLLMAAADGLWALERVSDDLDEPISRWLPLTELVDASLSRLGVRRDYNAFRSRYQAAAMPTLLVDWNFIPPGSHLDWSDSLGTTGALQPQWQLRARLTWSPRRNNSVALRGIDSTDDVLDTNVVVIDGEAQLLTGTDDYVVAARIERDVLGYQAELATQVTDLYRTRAELVAERPRMSNANLQRQVQHELAIDELEARLDALTDGAVTRWVARETPQEL